MKIAKETPGAQSFYTTVVIDDPTDVKYENNSKSRAGEVTIKGESRPIRSGVPEVTYSAVYSDERLNIPFQSRIVGGRNIRIRIGDIVRKEIEKAMRGEPSLYAARTVYDMDKVRSFMDTYQPARQNVRYIVNLEDTVGLSGQKTLYYDPLNPFKASENPADLLEPRTIYGAEKPQGGPLGGFYNYFAGVPLGIKQFADTALTGKSSVTIPESAENRLIESGIRGLEDVYSGKPSTVYDDLTTLKQDIISDKSGYYAGSIAATALFYGGTAFIGPAVTFGARYLPRLVPLASRAIGGVPKAATTVSTATEAAARTGIGATFGMTGIIAAERAAARAGQVVDVMRIYGGRVRTAANLGFTEARYGIASRIEPYRYVAFRPTVNLETARNLGRTATATAFYIGRGAAQTGLDVATYTRGQIAAEAAEARRIGAFFGTPIRGQIAAEVSEARALARLASPAFRYGSNLIKGQLSAEAAEARALGNLARPPFDYSAGIIRSQAAAELAEARALARLTRPALTAAGGAIRSQAQAEYDELLNLGELAYTPFRPFKVSYDINKFMIESRKAAARAIPSAFGARGFAGEAGKAAGAIGKTSRTPLESITIQINDKSIQKAAQAAGVNVGKYGAAGMAGLSGYSQSAYDKAAEDYLQFLDLPPTSPFYSERTRSATRTEEGARSGTDVYNSLVYGPAMRGGTGLKLDPLTGLEITPKGESRESLRINPLFVPIVGPSMGLDVGQTPAQTPSQITETTPIETSTTITKPPKAPTLPVMPFGETTYKKRRKAEELAYRRGLTIWKVPPIIKIDEKGLNALFGLPNKRKSRRK